MIQNRLKYYIKDIQLYEGCLEELKDFKMLLETLEPSKLTHYDKLDEWLNITYGFIHKKLKKYKFVNGGKALGIPQPIKAEFWWKLYSLPCGTIYSTNLITNVSNHHSSAHDRNNTLIKDLQEIIDYLT